LFPAALGGQIHRGKHDGDKVNTMSDLTLTTFGATRPRRRPAELARAVVRVAWLALARSRERRVLASLDARTLRDIGVTPYEAGVEARKPFWRA
jgi:uncharacterized protein YjiS (DUF1127 family)